MVVKLSHSFKNFRSSIFEQNWLKFLLATFSRIAFKLFFMMFYAAKYVYNTFTGPGKPFFSHKNISQKVDLVCLCLVLICFSRKTSRVESNSKRRNVSL